MQRGLLACEQAPSARPLPRAGAGSSDDDTDSDWQASSQDSADQQEFEPDEILAEAYDSSTGKRIYFVRWKSTEPGVDADKTWEPEANLKGAEGLIADLHESRRVPLHDEHDVWSRGNNINNRPES